MAKVTNPTTLSGYFELDPAALNRLDVLDQTLAIDTKLFIDPLLFQHSRHSEIRSDALEQYRDHFEQVIKFLHLTQTEGDVPWRTARRLLEFHEINGTCLGYGANSIQGSGFGSALTDRLLHVGKEIVDLGIRDPNLFPAMALFETGIGPDRISDMATNVIRRALISFNHHILGELGFDGEAFDVGGVSGRFLRNPFQPRPTPIILIPRDILRKLPIANDWDEVADAASQTQALRDRVNEHLGHLWAAKARRDKQQLKAQVLDSEKAFQTLLDVLSGVQSRAYDSASDPDGLVIWAHVAKRFSDQFPLSLRTAALDGLELVYRVVLEIASKFRQLVEHNGLNKELYVDGRKPRHESTAQRLFFAIAYCYCEANNVDISPEVDSGSGQIDFKLSTGFEERVLVEVKLSTNSKVVSGYQNQLEVYKQAEQTMRALYLVINVGQMGKKRERLTQIRDAASRRGEPLSDLVFVDGRIKPPASKR